MQQQQSVYLSGAMMNCTDEECRDWREDAKRQLKCNTRDPMTLRDYRGREHEAITEIVEYDKADIDACDILLVNYVKPSVGTSMEMLYAWERGKRVLLVAPRESVLSPWLLYHSHQVFHSMQDALAHINEDAALAPSTR